MTPPRSVVAVTSERADARAAVTDSGADWCSVTDSGPSAPAGSSTDSVAGLVVDHGTTRDELARILDRLPDLRWVQMPMAGIEYHLPMMRTRPEITWTCAKGSYAPPVAEHAVALTLALLRELPSRVVATSWGTPAGETLRGATVLVVGGGGIARALLGLLDAFGASTTIVRRSPDPVPGADRTVTTDRLDEHLPGADVVILAAAATEQTRSLIAAAQLAAMKPTAVLVNVARGSLVDTQALVDALAEGRIHAAGLDVTDPEPLPDAHPLWTQPRALITPHTADTQAMVEPLYLERVRTNVARFVAGQPLVGLVDLDAGY